MEIIEGLQREAKARRADSRKLMKVKDRKGELNLKFLKTQKLKSRTRAQKTYLNRNVFFSCSYWIINVVDCS